MNKCRDWCYFPNWLYTQLPSWLPHVPRNCNLFGIGVSSLHAPHTPGMWNRCEYRGTRKGRGLVTCGYASVIMASWEICKWRWPGKTSKWVIFHCHVWLEDTFWAVVSFVSLLTQPHGFELASISGWSCRVSKVDATWVRETKWTVLFRMALFSCRWAMQNRSIFFCSIGRFGYSHSCVDVFPRITWFKHVKKTSNHFERSGADEVSLSQHSRHPAGWLDDSLISLGFSWCSLQLKESKSECKQQNYDPKIIKICEHAKNKHGHSKLATKHS